MIRGTTPTYTFALSIPESDVADIWITFKQDLKLEEDKVLTKTKANGVTHEGGVVSLTLTQEETLSFVENIPIEIQGKVYIAKDGDSNGKVMATSIKKDNCERILCEEVMA